ncbi:ABC transporter permease [[Ruminococcus] torques]|uniref:ABC transporter permease n=1 Tax=[Ruminococcus] torques TaxID=33039 RepID=UPI0025A47D31|nr:ABC transporter permease [[Ruminococcus] torques]MDM8236371.1 ABC transporter permease [[Ruminococcus] torques]
MGAFLYGIGLQFKMDIRSRSLLVTCYLVPLLFFAVMGGIFTSIMPGSEKTLIQSMTVMGVSMGALIGVPPSLAEIYGTDVRKMYQANGAPLWYGLITLTVSAFIHLLIMSGIILAAAPVMFHAEVPSGLMLYFVKLSLFIIASLGIAGVLGMLEKNQAKLTMLCQAAFLPSILLSGIMFPSSLLPGILEKLGKLFPAAWGYLLLTENESGMGEVFPLGIIFGAAVLACAILMRRMGGSFSR